MDETLAQFLAELEQFGETNDRAKAKSNKRMLNITRDTGAFLSVIARVMCAKEILEIGTSNGYSTLWLADAAEAIGGRVSTVEISDFKVELAERNFLRSGLNSIITQIHADADHIIANTEDSSFDLIFLDSNRSRYLSWWSHLKRILRPSGLLVVDNAITHAENLYPFMSMIKADPEFTTSLVPVGNGEFLTTRNKV